MAEEEEPFEIRVGNFFVVMGAGAFIFFVISDFANNVDFDYFFAALILFFIGFYLRRNKAPRPSSGRFAWFKGAWGRMRGDRGGNASGDKKDNKGKEKKDKK